MAPFAKTTFVTGATPASATELNNFGDGIVEAQRAPYVTALPTTGPGGGALADGQECYFLPDPNNTLSNPGVAWHLKYRLSDAKWYCIGGQPFLTPYNAAAHVDITSAAYAAFTSAPSFTSPFPGIYRVRFGHGGFSSVAGGGLIVAPSANGVAPTDGPDSIISAYSAGTDQSAQSRSVNVTVATTGHIIALQAKQTGGTAKMRYAWMEVMPVRVG